MCADIIPTPPPSPPHRLPPLKKGGTCAKRSSCSRDAAAAAVTRHSIGAQAASHRDWIRYSVYMCMMMLSMESCVSCEKGRCGAVARVLMLLRLLLLPPQSYSNSKTVSTYSRLDVLAGNVRPGFVAVIVVVHDSVQHIGRRLGGCGLRIFALG